MTDNAVKTVTVELSVVLGRSQMPIHQLLKMGRGAVIELDTTVNDHAFIYANDTHDHVGITITDTVAPSGD
ncbi:MAG TPA: FliM/FliN family flagellar motor switch protein [Alphaproteobacteria bacterium]|nr:FliM/FliN family flagellar motor switch protein [Alphaproteobacteria bacterium]